MTQKKAEIEEGFESQPKSVLCGKQDRYNNDETIGGRVKSTVGFYSQYRVTCQTDRGG